jgi:predicted ribonuclease YlaK|tara:strand:- start:1235 stop:1891 length:657 start_codon:yes stop_codon:yes gene_type:complete
MKLKSIDIKPITKHQEETFSAWNVGDNLVLNGSAGTGKTFMSLYLGLNEVFGKSNHKKLVIIRSVVPTRDLGFLPGTVEEKLSAFETPYQQMCTELFKDKNSYETLKTKHQIEFLSTSYIRGTTFNDSILIIDECQNLTFHELDSIITRVGHNCRIIFCGDYYQSDFKQAKDKAGIIEFINIIEHLNSFSVIEFDWKDIVRSDFVRDYIMTKEMLEKK